MTEPSPARPLSRLSAELARVQRAVDACFDARLPVPGDPRDRLAEAMRYSAIGGGKRLRPVLVAQAAALFGGHDAQAILAGTAIEAIHVYSLIHDDLPCMDDDAMRHGKPALHIAFDEATAVLAGDSLHAFAFEVLADPATSADPAVRIDLVRVLAQASGLGGMAGGQMMDIAAETATFDLPTITRLQQFKTGALLAAAVEMGMILAGASLAAREPLRAYARDIGLAFQIADDLLDVEGDAAAMGKAVGKDAARGKQTFVSLLGLDGARARAQALVASAVANLADHGDKADVLREIAQFIVERKH